jgi:hypothetical protein
MLRKLILAGSVIALVTGPAAAQMPMPSMSLHNGPKQLTPEEQAKQKAIDDAYKAATQKIPDKQVANDPWGNVRSLPPTNSKRN